MDRAAFETDKASDHLQFQDEQILFDECTIDGDITIDDIMIPHDLDIESSTIKDKNIMAAEKDDDTKGSGDWDVLTSSEFVVDCAESKCAESDWDVLSSVQSVMSMDTVNTLNTKPTYSSIVSKRHPKCNTVNYNPTKTIHSRHRSMAHPKEKPSVVDPIMENQCSQYDAVEGYKFARGGKNALMFSGNPKQKKQNAGKRRESRNYRKAHSRNHY